MYIYTYVYIYICINYEANLKSKSMVNLFLVFWKIGSREVKAALLAMDSLAPDAKFVERLPGMFSMPANSVGKGSGGNYGGKCCKCCEHRW